MMTSAEIRQSFLDFFASKQHTIVPSASLMPTSPNLLFTNAGMNQFVPYFLGERAAPYKRAADTQKCIRAGGKHNDLDDVGFDTYHHTFFEMLGNWSFGDYFKTEAIDWAWELLTEVWHFPKERLYATVYQPGEGDPASFDHEAYACWEKHFAAAGLDPKIHIRTGGKKDNFWMMGDTGPCGPCSELHIDLTPAGDSGGELVNADSPYCIEIWNLVFIQFNAEEDGRFVPLKAQHVDTGMGFERVAGIIATTRGFTDYSTPPSNYNSDLFTDLFQFISHLSGHTYQATLPADRHDLSGAEMNDCIFRVLADHARTLAFSIADGIMPGNEGRNYVLRRILRRAVLFGKRLDLKDGFFARLMDPVIDKMGPIFPELIARRDIISKVVANEERSFERTLDRGLQLLDKITYEKNAITGDEAFILYDTYGFPIDLTEIIARERNLQLDLPGFEAAMEAQRTRARAAQKKQVISVSEGDDDLTHSTRFIGYDQIEQAVEATVLAVVESPKGTHLVFDQSPCYAEMGGQTGDHGTVSLGETSLTILNTIKDEAGRFLHHVEGGRGLDALVGRTVRIAVDSERRRAIERHHTATHLLHWALREELGDHVHQAGSLVNEHHLRFDFSHYEAPSREQLDRIEHAVNQRILANAPVRWFEVPFDDKPANCLAFFGEKYGAVVRVVDIGGYSVELCGGTHVRATGELGLVKITAESSIAAGTRRIEAVAGLPAHQLAENDFQHLHRLALRLGCPVADLENRLNHLLDQRETLEKELRGLQQKQASAEGDALLTNAIQAKGLNWIIGPVQVAGPEDLRGLAAGLAKQHGPAVVVLGAAFADKVTVVAVCSPEAIAAGHKAGALIADLTARLGGKGGGKPDFAMGGGKDIAALPGALDALRSSVTSSPTA